MDGGAIRQVAEGEPVVAAVGAGREAAFGAGEEAVGNGGIGGQGIDGGKSRGLCLPGGAAVPAAEDPPRLWVRVGEVAQPASRRIEGIDRVGVELGTVDAGDDVGTADGQPVARAAPTGAGVVAHPDDAAIDRISDLVREEDEVLRLRQVLPQPPDSRRRRGDGAPARSAVPAPCQSVVVRGDDDRASRVGDRAGVDRCRCPVRAAVAPIEPVPRRAVARSVQRHQAPTAGTVRQALGDQPGTQVTAGDAAVLRRPVMSAVVAGEDTVSIAAAGVERFAAGGQHPRGRHGERVRPDLAAVPRSEQEVPKGVLSLLEDLDGHPDMAGIAWVDRHGVAGGVSGEKAQRGSQLPPVRAIVVAPRQALVEVIERQPVEGVGS